GGTPAGARIGIAAARPGAAVPCGPSVAVSCGPSARAVVTARIVGMYVDLPAGQLVRQPCVLPFLADGQGELVVRHDDLGQPGVGIDDVDPGDAGGGQGVGHELRGVLRVVDDVDLLPVQFGHHVPDPAAHRPDTGALGVHAA